MLGALALSACPLSEPVVKIPAGEAGALVVIERSNGQAPVAFALGLEDGRARPPFVSFPLPSRLPATLYALHYPCSLGALGLDAGPIAFLSASAEGGRALPPPKAIEVAEIERGENDRFEPIAVLPPQIAQLRIAGEAPRPPSPCIELARVEQRLVGTRVQGLRFFVRLGADDALGGTADGRFIRVRANETIELTQLATSTPHLGAFRTDEGELWLAGEGGRTVHGHPDRGFLPGPSLTLPAGTRRIWLDGARGGAPLELFAVTGRQTFERFDGRAWSVIAAGNGEDIYDRAGVVWIAPGEAIAIGFDPQRLLHYKDGAAIFETLPLTRNDQPLVAAYVPGFGAMIGTALGTLLYPKNGGWERIVRDEIAPQVRVIGALGDAVVFGGSTGALAQYDLAVGFCPTQVLFAGHLAFLVSFGRSLMVVGRTVGSDETVTIATEIARPQRECSAGR